MLLFTQFKHVWSELIFHLIAKILSIKNDAFNCNLYLTDWFACIWLLSDGDSYNIGGKMIMLLIFSIFDHRLVVTNKNCLQNHYRLWFIARDRSLGCEPFQEKMTYIVCHTNSLLIWFRFFSWSRIWLSKIMRCTWTIYMTKLLTEFPRIFCWVRRSLNKRVFDFHVMKCNRYIVGINTCYIHSMELNSHHLLDFSRLTPWPIEKIYYPTIFHN